MERRHVILEKLGSGTYGIVWRAYDKYSCDYVAIKQLIHKYGSRDECMNLIEVKALMMNNHPNIVKLIRTVKDNGTLYLVFENMECDVYGLLKRTILSETKIRNMCFQIFNGLAYLHGNGYIHRDLKPANLLVCGNLVKIADFGLAMETNGRQAYNHNVTTESYRAPEVFLRSPTYDSAIDMWSMGVIMAELFTNKSLFRCCETHGIFENICRVLGTPTKTTWSRGLKLAEDMFYQFPNSTGVRFSSLLPYASSDAINLISSLLSWDPSLRPTAEQVLQHPFFYSCYRVPRTINIKYTSIIARPSIPPGFEKLTHPKVNEIDELDTGKSGIDELDLEDMARFLPENLFDF